MKRVKIVAVLATAALIIGFGAVFLFGGDNTKPASGDPTTSTTVEEETTTTTTVAVPDEYALIYYQFVPGVPENYFGPACTPNGDPVACREDLKERIKHDPMLLSVQMRNFKLLPDWNDQMPADEVEKLRRDWQAKLEADWHLRQEWSMKVSAVLDTLQNLRIEALSGPYYTEYVSADGTVHQAQKQMDPAVNVALVGEDLEGNTLWTKLDCGHQTVSPNPLPGVPEGPLPPGETPPPPPETPVCPPDMPYGTPPICKDGPERDINNNPDLPDQVRKTQPSPDNQSEIDRGPTAPIDSPTGCNGACAPPPGSPPPPPPSSDPGRGDNTTGTTTPPTTTAPPPTVPNPEPPPGDGGITPR